MFQLVQSKLFLFFLQNELLALKLIFKIFSLPFQSSNLLISFFFYLGTLTFQLFHFFFEFRDDLFVDFLSVWLLFFQFIFNFLHLFLLYYVSLVQLADLLLFLVYRLNLFLRFLGQLLQLFLHSTYLICCFFVFVIFQSLFLSFSYFLQRLFLLLQCLELSFEVFQLVFLLNDLIDIILAVQISSQFGDLRLVFLDAQLLFLKLFFKLNHPFVLLALPRSLFLLFPFFLLLHNFVHFCGQLLQLPLQLHMLLNELCLPK